MKVVTVRITDAVHTEIKELAYQSRQSMNTYILNLLKNEIERKRNPPPRTYAPLTRS